MEMFSEGGDLEAAGTSGSAVYKEVGAVGGDARSLWARNEKKVRK